jgi:PAS domain S-box-containing protein
MTILPTPEANNSFSEGISGVIKSLRLRLWFLFFAIALAAFAMIVFLSFQARSQVIESQRDLSERELARVIHAQAKRIEDTRLFLSNLAQAPAVQDSTAPACGQFLSEILPMVPQFANLGVPEVGGDLLCSAIPLNNLVNVADRPYIRRAFDDRIFSVGTFQVDRAAQMTSVNFAYPIVSDVNGARLVGAAVAVVSLDWWGAELKNAELPDDTVAYIIDSDQQVIAAYPSQPNLLGLPWTESEVTVGESEEGATEIVLRSDGVRRVFTHSPLFGSLENNQVFMSLGVPVEAGFSAVNRRLTIQLTGLGSALVAIWLLTAALMDRRVFHPLRAMNSEIKRIENDDGLSGGQDEPYKAGQMPAMQKVTQSFQRITRERLQAQADRRVQAEQITALIDALPDTYFRLDKASRILDYRSQAASDLLIEPEDSVGQPLSKVLPEDAFREFEKNLALHLKTGEIVSWHYRLNLKSRPRFFEARLCRIVDSDEMVMVVRDITKRYLADDQRRIAETRLKQIIANLPGAVVALQLTDSDDLVPTFVSQQASQIWGYTPEEIYADSGLLLNAYTDADVAGIVAKLRKAATTQEPFKDFILATSETGEKKWLEIHTSVTQLEDGRINSVGFALDMTKSVETEAQLELQREVSHQALKQESIGQLTGGIAHDFNNLLAVIMGNLELLRDDVRDEDQLSLIDAGIDASKRGASLTRNMLSFARKAPLETKVLKLNKLISDTSEWSGRTLPASISIETNLSADLWNIEADQSSTESAILNLILNARDAMPNGGKLTLSTENVQVDQTYVDKIGENLQQGPYVMLTVSDTGTGIPANELVQVFEPFFSTKAPGAGSGLGLSMILGFMKQSGGTVRVYSEPEIGSTFNLYFRAVGGDDGFVNVALVEAESTVRMGRRILVAEDESQVLSVIVATLEKAGYVVTPAATGDEARAIYETDPTFDLLLTDIVMPGSLQGTELSKILREQVPDLRVIFMSGYAREAMVHGNGLRPEDIRLSKPVLRADLLEAIRKAFDM